MIPARAAARAGPDLRMRKALDDEIVGRAMVTVAAWLIETPVAVRLLKRRAIEPKVLTGQTVRASFEQHLQSGENRADMQHVMAVVRLKCELEAGLVESAIRLGQVRGQRSRAFRHDVLGERGEREGLELEAEGVDLAREGRMLAIEVQRRADQEEKVFHRHQVAHLLARDL